MRTAKDCTAYSRTGAGAPWASPGKARRSRASSKGSPASLLKFVTWGFPLRHPPPWSAKPVAGFPGKPSSLSRDFARGRDRMERSGFPSPRRAKQLQCGKLKTYMETGRVVFLPVHPAQPSPAQEGLRADRPPGAGRQHPPARHFAAAVRAPGWDQL